MKIFLSILFISFCSLTSLGQSDEPIHITWEDLEDVSYKDVYLDSLETWFWKPEFGKELLKLEGKEFQIDGYFFEIDRIWHFIQTKFIYNSHQCFSVNGNFNMHA